MGVSKHTLFHYDDIGLFSPEYVAENGYRMYSRYQLETLETILMLRDLGMPLKEIRQFLQVRSPKELVPDLLWKGNSRLRTNCPD